MSSILGILKSYGTWLTATPEQKLVAAQRITSCKSCEHWSGRICKLCGCPTAVKVFHHDKNECPHPDGSKWKV